MGVFNRKPHAPTLKEALSWSAVWIGLGLAFGLWVYHEFGYTKAEEYYAGFVLEKVLSFDNVFVFYIIMSSLSIPQKFQHKILFWGVLGAIFFRAIFIFSGAYFVQKYDWSLVIFGIILLFMGIKTLLIAEKDESHEQSYLMKLIHRYFPINNDLKSGDFFTMKQGQLSFSPLFVAVILIEISDIIFAVDSVPAIFSITKDPMIIYTSNIAAILGLRSLYFVISYMLNKFKYLKTGVALILCFIGVKMLMIEFYIFPKLVSLSVILGIFILSVLYSLFEIKKR